MRSPAALIAADRFAYFFTHLPAVVSQLMSLCLAQSSLVLGASAANVTGAAALRSTPASTAPLRILESMMVPPCDVTLTVTQEV